MPRFFDDYSNTYLTHDSAAGRKQQRRGWKFRENFKLHYEKHMQAWRSGPMGLASAQQAFTRQTGQKPPLPPGWKEDLDEVAKASFYSNEETGERSWVRPNFFPPGQGGGGGGGGPPPRNFPPSSGPPPPMMNQNRGPPQQPPPQFRVPPPSNLPPPPRMNNGGPPPNNFRVPPPNFPPPGR